MSIVNNYKIEPKANLRGADLRGADLRGAELREADLRGANLRGANLRGADLRGANLRGANLRGADLRGADLHEADLREADLRWANLRGADLHEANLREADLHEANLREADLRWANLRGADLRWANLPDYQICPETGSFEAWKKVNSGVIKLFVPAEAKRTSSLVSRKCRAEFVDVLAGSGTSIRKGRYTQGGRYYPDSYCDDIRIECSDGVHFFMTKKEAEEYR